MIQPQTVVNVADNSGAKKLLVIRVLGRTRHQRAVVGDVIIGVVKDASPNVGLKKSDVVRAVIVRSRVGVQRTNASLIRFDDNAAVVLNKDDNPRGSRIFGPVARELRSRQFTKIVSLASEVL